MDKSDSDQNLEMFKETERIEEEIEASDVDFACVRISEFYSPRKIAFDLYLRLGADLYLRIFRAGEIYAQAELKAYERERGLSKVYFLKKHRAVYVNASANLLRKVLPLTKVPMAWKFRIARILSELYMQELFDASPEERGAIVDRGREIAVLIAQWIHSAKDLENFVLDTIDIDPSPESISFLTGMLAALISRRFSWTSQRTTETLIFASFLCDLGLAALPPEISRLRPKRMNTQQRRQYEEHPEISYRLLQECGAKSLTQNVLLIVREHHEYCDGSGFPNKLSLALILQLSKLVTLAGDLIRTSQEYLLPPSQAVTMLFPELSGKIFTDHPELCARYDHELLKSLFSFFREGKGDAAA